MVAGSGSKIGSTEAAAAGSAALPGSPFSAFPGFSPAGAMAATPREMGRIFSTRTTCEITDLNSLNTTYTASSRPCSNSTARESAISFAIA